MHGLCATTTTSRLRAVPRPVDDLQLLDLLAGAQTLALAQEAKLELGCRTLELEPDQRVLDIGCGWGGFAIHAAKRHGAQVVGVTLSPPQAKLARRLVADAGLEDQIEIRVADYRELADEPFDAVASIGMIEHVGARQIDAYAAQVAWLLRPGGRALGRLFGSTAASRP
jgi:cyclopropane-fatty-acyl-phospholipid synthase